ncbi:protein 5NUC-like [Culicoides brevitarsis]|uniref:protein 5NUC-like n=1 Tax=Culicoides brevitarsis TaxID=469753 RepID=UPI00307CB88F
MQIFLLTLLIFGLTDASVISLPLSSSIDAENGTIGTTAVELDGETCKKAECNFGNLVADSVRYGYLEDHSTGENVLVLLQGKNFKGVIEQGTELTEKDLANGFSKQSDLVIIKELKGKLIRDVLEKSVEKYTQKDGSPDFLQVSGGFFEFDLSVETGKRLTSAQLMSFETESSIEITDKGTYSVITTEDFFKTNFQSEKSDSLETTDIASLEKYIAKHKIVYPAIDERIILHNIEAAPEGNNALTLQKSTFLIGIMILLQKCILSSA